MKKAPNTVTSRVERVLALIFPEKTESEIKEIANNIWYTIDYLAKAPLKEDVDVSALLKDVLGLAVGGFETEMLKVLHSARQGRQLSTATKVARLIQKATDIGVLEELKELLK